MNPKIKLDEFPEILLEAVGFIANYERLRVHDVHYNASDQTISFPLLRFPIIGRSVFAVTCHANDPVLCRVKIRNVTECLIKDHPDGM